MIMLGTHNKKGRSSEDDRPFHIRSSQLLLAATADHWYKANETGTEERHR
jgi:hypothetical protein